MNASDSTSSNDDTPSTGAHATLLSASGGAVGVLSYAVTLVMAHLLDAAGYTAFAAAAALVGTAGVASAALVPFPLAHVVRASPDGAPERRDAMTFAVGVSVLVGLGAALVLGALTAGFAPAGTAVAAAVSALALFAIAPVWGHLQGESRFARYAALTVGEVAVRLVASIVAVALGAGAAGAVGAFAVGALAVLAAATTGPLRALAPRRLPAVLRERARWAETGGVAATQAVLSVLAVADLVVVAATLADGPASAGYQAVATLAKAPIYVGVGTALVSFPLLRARRRDADLLDALTAFVRLVVPATVVVATVPPVLVGLVLPAPYAASAALLPWLAVAGAGLGTTTVVATLLLAIRARRALVPALAVAVVTLAAGIGGGLALLGGTRGTAVGVAVGAVAGALGVVALAWPHRPRALPRRAGSLGRVAVRGLAYTLLVIALLVVAGRSATASWVLAVVVLGLLVAALPVVGGRMRSAACQRCDIAGTGRARSHILGLDVVHLAFEDPAMPGSGGGALRTSEIDRRLAAAGHRIIVVTTRYPGAVDRTEQIGDGVLRWVHVGAGRGATRLTRLLGYVAGVPVAVRSLDADLVIEDFFAPISSMGVPWFSPAPTVAVVQWLNAREKARQYRLPVHWVERLGVRSHRRFVAMSHGVADALRALQPAADVAVIGNGVAEVAFEVGRRTDGRDVVFVGRLEIAQKGLDLLVDAWARLDLPGRLVLAGTGPDEEVLRARVRSLGIAHRVRFAGWVAGADKFALLAGARLVAIPSRFETFGIVAAEALAAGSAVVAYDIPCLREVVPAHDRLAGVLVPLTGDHDADVAAYAAALADAYTDDGLVARAAEQGAALAAVHDWDALAADQDAFLRRAVR